MTISFSYAYLSGLERRIVSSPCVQMRVQRPSLAMSPRMTKKRVSRIVPRKDGTFTIHEYSLCDIVCVVAGDNVIHVEAGGATVKSLPSEYSTERA